VAPEHDDDRPDLRSCTSRAALGMFSSKLRCCGTGCPGEPNEVEQHREAFAEPALAASYCGGSWTSSVRTNGSPSGLSANTCDVCSSVTTRPESHVGRFNAMAR
jgi:hypothetical protein